MGKKSKQVSTNDPSKFAAPYITDAANQLKSVGNANAGNVAALSSDMNSVQSILSDRLRNPSAIVGNAKSYAADVLGGNYLGGNPYLDSMTGLARENAFNDISSAFGRSGMTGSTGFGKSLGQGISNAELALRYQDYGTERDRMDQMALNSGTLENIDLAALPAYLEATQLSANLPLTNAMAYASGTGGLLGNYTTQTQTTKQGLGNTLGQLAGMGLSAYGLGMFGGGGSSIGSFAKKLGG